MARDSSVEPFPPMRTEMSHLENSASIKSARAPANGGLRRRQSSNLPEDPRGDTGGSAIATYNEQISQDSAASPTASNNPSTIKSQPERGRKRRKAKSLFRRWKSISFRHTWLNPLILTLIVLAIYAVNPSESNPVHAAIFLSYPLPRGMSTAYDPASPLTGPIHYGKGAKDFAFVAFYTVVFSFTREFLMQRLIKPMAVRCGIRSKAKQSRFMEQFYTAIYFGIMGPFGLYVMRYHSPLWYFNIEAMYETFPNKSHEGPFKAYYLLQAGYWAQQGLVLLLQLEKPRKDFKELVGHHITTLALIWLSYRFHFTYMGLPVYITHDVSDFFLATSKILNYLDSPIVEPFFGTFILIWAYCRHYLNLRIIWSVLTTFRTIGPFEVNWETQQYKCWISQYITFGLLASLQSLNVFWFFLILRIAKNIVFNDKVEDERSEYGSDDEMDENVPVQNSTKEKRERMAQLLKDETDSPSILLNGAPVAADAQATGVQTRSSTRRKG